jgi:hypothetical protein
LSLKARLKDKTEEAAVRFVLKKSSPEYCVKSKAIVFNFTFVDYLSKPFHFFLTKLPWFFIYISGEGCQRLFTLTALPGYVIIP